MRHGFVSVVPYWYTGFCVPSSSSTSDATIPAQTMSTGMMSRWTCLSAGNCTCPCEAM